MSPPKKSVRRRKTLIAVADVLSSKTPAPLNAVQQHSLVKDIPTVEVELREFVTRRVLVGDKAYHFKVPVFYRWLVAGECRT